VEIEDSFSSEVKTVSSPVQLPLHKSARHDLDSASIKVHPGNAAHYPGGPYQLQTCKFNYHSIHHHLQSAVFIMFIINPISIYSCWHKTSNFNLPLSRCFLELATYKTLLLLLLLFVVG
jgi:hypothetical protein